MADVVSTLLLGAGAGLGLWLIVVGLFPPKPTLSESLAAALNPPPPARPVILTRRAQGWAATAGRPGVRFLAGFGLPRAGIRRDLAVLGRSSEQHLGEQVTAAVLGLISPVLLAALTAMAGVNTGLVAPLWVALGLAAAGFFLPDLAIKSEAAQRRADFRYALSAFLDLVVIALAGGAGIDGALDDSANTGNGWAFDQIRRALASARVTRTPPWQALARLGAELDVPQLEELAASVSLAGSEGAKIRASLAAKAAALRTQQLSDAESAAQSDTERMSVPVVLLFAGFLLFLAYPAVMTVMTTL